MLEDTWRLWTVSSRFSQWYVLCSVAKPLAEVDMMLMTSLTQLGVMPILQKFQPLMIWLWPGFHAHFRKMVTYNEMAAKCVLDRQQRPSGRQDILNYLFALNAERPDFTVEEIFNDSFDAL
jgi:hypothetical protein